MNRHFTDARYYLQRAAEHAKLGFTEEAEPVVARVQRLRGNVPAEDAEQRRIDRFTARLDEASLRAETAVRRAYDGVRRRIGEYRDSRRNKPVA